MLAAAPASHGFFACLSRYRFSARLARILLTFVQGVRHTPEDQRDCDRIAHPEGGEMISHVVDPISNRIWRLAAALLASAFPALSGAEPITYSTGAMTFSTADQSMWSPGGAFVLDKTVFLGAQWTESTSIGPGVSCVDLILTEACGGFRVGFATDGKVGFEMGLKVDSGSVDASVVFDASALLPDAASTGTGEFFNLNPSSLLTGGSLTSQSPTLEAYVDALLGARASVDGIACILACVDPAPLTVGAGSRDNPYRIELLSFNEGGNGQIEILDDPGLLPYNFDERIGIEVAGTDVGGLTVHLPQIATSGGVTGNSLTSSGADDLLALDVDIDGLLTLALGLPPLEGSLSIADVVELSYNVLDVQFGPVLEVLQDFELRPTLMVDLQFDQPILVAGSATPVTSLTSAWNSLPDIAMLSNTTLATPTFYIANTFTNSLGLGIDALLTVAALSAGYDIVGPGGQGSIGPLYALTQRFGIADFPSLYDFTFELGGFSEVNAASFAIRVPEPGTLALLAIALLAASAGRRGSRSARQAAGRARA
jgi:hypothetical protein